MEDGRVYMSTPVCIILCDLWIHAKVWYTLNVTGEHCVHKCLVPLQVVQLYQELLYSLHFGQMSMDDHCAEDIVTVIKTMQQAGIEIRMHYVYPALARYSQEGNIKGMKLKVGWKMYGFSPHGDILCFPACLI